MAAKLLWLSYIDKDGDPIGVAVIEVTAAEARACIPRLRALHPDFESGSEYVWAAMMKTKELGIHRPNCVVVPIDIEPGCVPKDCIGRFLNNAELIERGIGRKFKL